MFANIILQKKYFELLFKQKIKKIYIGALMNWCFIVNQKHTAQTEWSDSQINDSNEPVLLVNQKSTA